MMPLPSEVDVAIIGAGPAGSVSSAILARAGLRVLVLERSWFPRHVIGESLLPRCCDLLERAGLLEAVKARGYMPKHGATFYRAGRRQRFAFRDNLPGDWTSAYEVPRDDFDQTLATAARAQGADIRFGTSVVEAAFDGEGATLTLEELEFEARAAVRARFVLDASGPARVLSRHLGLEEPADILVRTARYTHVEGDARPEGEEAGDIWVTLHDNGAWIWIIPFSNGRTSVGVVADDRTFDEHPGTDMEQLWAILRSEPAAASRLQAARPVMRTQKLRGWTTLTKKLHGPRWVIAGNAGDFLDPVFSSGVMFALESGSLAAGLIQRELAGETVDWEADYAAVLRQAIGIFRTFVKAWYTGDLPDIFFFRAKPMAAVRHITSILGGNVRNLENPLVACDTRAGLDKMLDQIRKYGPSSARP